MSTYHWQECRDCDEQVWTQSYCKTVLCPECRQIARNRKDMIYNHRRRRDQAGTLQRDELMVLHDPDNLGGFHKGAILLREEIKCMVRNNHAAFTIGTLLLDSAGRHFTVIELEKGGQKLQLA